MKTNQRKHENKLKQQVTHEEKHKVGGCPKEMRKQKEFKIKQQMLKTETKKIKQMHNKGQKENKSKRKTTKNI